MSMGQTDHLAEGFQEFRRAFGQILGQISRVVIGHDDIITQTLSAMMVGGHVLLDGVPGLGKTLLARTLGQVMNLSFRRIQCTPDLLPADLTGTNILSLSSASAGQPEFRRGPVFTNILLADEINRASPKTQSALLEAMQEQTVTLAGQTHKIDAPFFVIATQNPLEREGVYPLPVAQLDRFLLKLVAEFPSVEDFELILERTTADAPVDIQPIFDGKQIARMRSAVRCVPVGDSIRRHAIRLVMATHPAGEHPSPLVKRYVRHGASPRAGQAMILVAKVLAVLDGRTHVSREDLESVVLPAMRHRIVLNFEAQAEGITADRILRDVIEQSGQW